MLVADLQHFLDLPADVPGPARRLAEQLCSIVRAATAGRAGRGWVTALTCQRRPGHQACTGHVEVFRADLPAPIEWRCTACGDEGVISGWEGSHADLRLPHGEGPTSHRGEVAIPEEVAAALRDLRLLDTDAERLIYRARATDRGVVLAADADELDELMGYVAAEANHESNRRRAKRLDVAFTALGEAIETLEMSPTVDDWSDEDDEENDDEFGPTDAVIYLRVSDGRRQAALEEQWEVCASYVAQHGWTLVGRVEDVGVPGMHELPGLAGLMGSGDDLCVVTTRLDRLGSSAADIAGVIEAITDDGTTELHAVLDEFCSPNDVGVLYAIARAEGGCLDDRTQLEHDADHQRLLAEAAETVRRLPSFPMPTDPPGP